MEGLQFAPQCKHVLSRVLPILGGVGDTERLVFAKGETQWLALQAEYNF